MMWICKRCHGNGYIRLSSSVAAGVGGAIIDCETCNSLGELMTPPGPDPRKDIEDEPTIEDQRIF